MSRSNPHEKLVNPSGKFYEWSGDKGQFFYFDKNKGDKGEKVFMKMPFNFLVLDTLSTCKGFDDSLCISFFRYFYSSVNRFVINSLSFLLLYNIFN